MIDWPTWQPDQNATLLYVIRDNRMLLIDKKRGIGAGKINGPGGRVDPGETPLEAAIRETREELLITPLAPRKLGDVLFHVLDGVAIHIHVFRADDYEGEPTETEEAVPVWAPLDAIPYDRMWADDEIWFPALLADRPFSVRTVFRGDELVWWEIEDEEGRGRARKGDERR